MKLPEFSFNQTAHLGISFSDLAIRAVALDEAGNPQKFAQVISAVPIVGEDKPASVLIPLTQDLKNQLNPQYPFAAVSIPEKYAYTRQHVLPDVAPQEIDEAIGWQIETIFPFSKSDIYYDWRLLAASSKKTTVLVTAAPKLLLDNLRESLQAAGLTPVSFEPSASALTRLIDPQASLPIIIVELDSSGTTSTLVVNGISLLTTTTFFNQTSDPQTVLSDLLSSIKSLILRSPDSNNQNCQIYITGEKASPQISELLSRELNVPAQVLTVSQADPAYHLAYIAAKTQVEAPDSTHSINLLPTGLQNAYKAQMEYNLAQKALRLVTAFVIPSLLLSLSVLIFSLFMVNQVAREKALLEETPPAVLGGLNLGQVNRNAARYNRLFSAKITPENLISQIMESVPEDITITNIVFDVSKNSLQLVGQSKERDVILQFKNTLQSLDLFSKVNLPLTSLDSNSDGIFVIDLVVKKG